MLSRVTPWTALLERLRILEETMKKTLLAISLALAAFFAIPTLVQADGCYLCGSGSTNGCQQCRYGSNDSGDARKACEKKGCKIEGTASCSTAANIKVCKLETKSAASQIIAYYAR